MKRKLSNIVLRSAAIILLLLWSLASAMAQRTVYQGTKTKLEVDQYTGDTYQWELYSDPNVNFAVVPGNCPPTSARFIGGGTGPSADVEWLLPGIYFYKVTAWNASGCTNNLKIGMIKVIPYEVDAIIAGAPQAGLCNQIRLDASSSVGKLTSYQWSALDAGATLTSPNTAVTEVLLSSSYSGTLPADFRISLKVTNEDGKSDTDTISIRFNPPPVANVYSDNKPQKDGSMIVDGSVSTGIGLHYKWSTNEGKIIGADDQPSAMLLGRGIYKLEISDIFGCTAVKTFSFPLEQYTINANPDYARTSWAQDTTIFILNNDRATAPLMPGTVRVITPPAYGTTTVNPDGSVIYTPTVRKPGRDQFTYEVCDAVSLCDSAIVTIDIFDAGVEILEGFSPNGDGQNDYMVFKGLEHYPKSRLHVYTRSGQLVYSSMDYLNDWNGRLLKINNSQGELLPTGVYYYVLELGGTTRIIKGFVYIGY